MKKIVLAIDSYKGCLSSKEVETCVEQELHGRGFQAGKDAFADDLLYDQRHGDDDVGLDFGKGLEDDLRAGDAGQEIDVHPGANLI